MVGAVRTRPCCGRSLDLSGKSVLPSFLLETVGGFHRRNEDYPVTGSTATTLRYEVSSKAREGSFLPFVQQILSAILGPGSRGRTKRHNPCPQWHVCSVVLSLVMFCSPLRPI